MTTPSVSVSCFSPNRPSGRTPAGVLRTFGRMNRQRNSAHSLPREQRPFPRFLPFLGLAALGLLTQCRTAETQTPEERLLAHVTYLADDRLAGRETGTEGESLALAYIQEQFALLGLQPAGSDGFSQPFEFTAGKTPAESSGLTLNGMRLVADTEFYALAQSGEGSGEGPLTFGGYGVSDPVQGAFLEAGMAQGKVLLLDLSVPDGYHPHSDFADYADVRTKIDAAVQAGASALVLFTRDPQLDVPEKYWDRKVTESSLPVFWLTPAGYSRVFGQGDPGDGSANYSLTWNRDRRTGHNVLALLDHPNTDRVVVIGAHYDHLGHGISGSLHNGEPAIHNGADDNASGVAGMLELARMLKEQGPDGSDYLFVAFSGEELGLYGSKHFVKSALFDTTDVSYMINFDMIGRLDTVKNALVVDGANASPAFSVLESLAAENGPTIRAGGSGIGSSDHMSFYLEGIPALHFFTGTHQDYHRPSDDVEKLNVPGIVAVLGVAHRLIQALDDDGKLDYVAVQDSSEAVPEFKVTLGVIPDYLFEGQGMRIESVREGRPAANAGLKDGDVVVRLGDVEVVDMMAYMKALGKFNKGETTAVEYLRNDERLSGSITF